MTLDRMLAVKPSRQRAAQLVALADLWLASVPASAQKPPALQAAAEKSAGGGASTPRTWTRRPQACRDFYQYADGGWLKKNPIPPEYPSWGTFNELAERNRELAPPDPRAARRRTRPRPRAPTSRRSATSTRAAWTRRRSRRRASSRSQPELERIDDDRERAPTSRRRSRASRSRASTPSSSSAPSRTARRARR